MRCPRFVIHLIWVLMLLSLAGCGCVAPFDKAAILPVADVRDNSQDPMAYVADPAAGALSSEQQAVADAGWNERFFAPWSMSSTGLTAQDAFWGMASYGSREGYAENLHPHDSAFFPQLVERVGAESFPNMARRGILVATSHVRVMPTVKPFFYDFKQAGEGFPFDYFQNSVLWAGTPVFVSHRSTDRGWVYVESGLVSGWVRTRDVAWVDQDFVDRYMTGRYAAVADDEASLAGADGEFLADGRIGSIFPISDRDDSGLTLLVPVRDQYGKALIATARAATDTVIEKPLPFNAANAGLIARQLIGEPYGWGGMYGNRDCSAMLHDLLTPFGLWLPRNSRAQGATGLVVDLEELAPDDKERVILERGVPFRTLVYMPGHIMLYVGEKDGRAMVMHNIWGIRTQDEDGEQSGRNIIGRAVITTLTPGRELENLSPEKGLLLNRVKSISILGE